jgi:hypothetical protein
MTGYLRFSISTPRARHDSWWTPKSSSFEVQWSVSRDIIGMPFPGLTLLLAEILDYDPASVGLDVRAGQLDSSGMQGWLGSIVRGGRHCVRRILLLFIGWIVLPKVGIVLAGCNRLPVLAIGKSRRRPRNQLPPRSVSKIQFFQVESQSCFIQSLRDIFIGVIGQSPWRQDSKSVSYSVSTPGFVLNLMFP